MNKSEKSEKTKKRIPIQDAMYAGNKELTMRYLASDNEYGQAWAIGACVKHHYTDEETFRLLEALQHGDGAPMGIPVRDLATGALHVLGLKEYTGDQENILWMIKDKFQFALVDRRKLNNNNEAKTSDSQKQ